jgi:hypothetical protein
MMIEFYVAGRVWLWSFKPSLIFCRRHWSPPLRQAGSYVSIMRYPDPEKLPLDYWLPDCLTQTGHKSQLRAVPDRNARFEVCMLR